MSYRLIDSNAIAIKYPEVNEMPCVFANLPDGINGQFIDAQPESRTDMGCPYCREDSDGYVKPLEKNCHAFIRFGMNGWELSLKANGWHGSAKIRYCPMCGRDLLVRRGEKHG